MSVWTRATSLRGRQGTVCVHTHTHPCGGGRGEGRPSAASASAEANDLIAAGEMMYQRRQSTATRRLPPIGSGGGGGKGKSSRSKRGGLMPVALDATSAMLLRKAVLPGDDDDFAPGSGVLN